MDLDHDYTFGEPEQNTCRVCLSTDSYAFFHLLDCGLQNDFHNVTGIQISPDDELPKLICCICRELLRKAAAFRKMSISTQNIFTSGWVTINDKNTVTTPLICFTQTDTLIISIPPASPTEDVETITIDLEDESIKKEENVYKSEREDNVIDSETTVKAEANEHAFDDHDDFDMDIESTSDVNNDSVKNVVIVKDVNAVKSLEKAKPKAKVRSKKFPKPNKGDPKMDAQSVKDYLLRTNTNNIYAEMLYTYIISKYIDGTKESNANIDTESVTSEDSEDESVPLNKLIKVEDDSAEIINVLTVQSNLEDGKQTLYEFMKEKYIEKKQLSKRRRARDLVRIKFKRDGRVVQSLKAMEELRKKYNLEIKILPLHEQIAEVKDRANSENYTHSQYKCDECFRGFQFERAYNYHMKGHDPAVSGNFKCEVCSNRFANKRKLIKHQVIHKFRFICKECGRVCKTQNIAKQHAQTHTGEKYKCEYCFKLFCKPATRINHIRIKHGSLQCDICYDLLAPGGLAMHNVFRHRETFKCECCDKKFNDADALAVHTSDSTNGVCSERPCTKCGEGFSTESEWSAHVEDHRQDVKRHERAKYNIRYKNRRQNPISEETGLPELPRTVMCEMCGDMFISQAAMRYHQRIHTGEKPYACTYCPKRFRLRTLLTMHINTHTGERPFKCEKCPKDFRSQNGLYRHQLVHTKERRHRCTICDKTFQTSSAVKLHVKTVHFKVPMPPRVRNRKKRAE